MTSLSNRLNQSDVFQSQKSLCRSAVGTGRRRVTSDVSSGSPDVRTDVEARVLVINTGGTIGMIMHDGGKHHQLRFHT